MKFQFLGYAITKLCFCHLLGMCVWLWPSFLDYETGAIKVPTTGVIEGIKQNHAQKVFKTTLDTSSLNKHSLLQLFLANMFEKKNRQFSHTVWGGRARLSLLQIFLLGFSSHVSPLVFIQSTSFLTFMTMKCIADFPPISSKSSHQLGARQFNSMNTDCPTPT